MSEQPERYVVEGRAWFGFNEGMMGGLDPIDEDEFNDPLDEVFIQVAGKRVRVEVTVLEDAGGG